MTNSVELIFASSRYGRKGRPSFEVTSDEWPASVTRWLWPAMEQYAARLRLVHINLTEWDSLKGTSKNPCFQPLNGQDAQLFSDMLIF